jgi:putative Mn2+ efflux pump MntP
MAVLIGHRAGMRFRRPAEILGGLVLIAIGTRILMEHLGVW